MSGILDSVFGVFSFLFRTVFILRFTVDAALSSLK